MPDSEFDLTCEDSSQRYSVQIPGTLLKRVETYATENDTSITNVVIEALDYFLRTQGKR
jgi:hypothetical protein